MMPGTSAAGAVMTTSSGTNGSLSRLLTAAMPPISAWRVFTRPNGPLNSAFRIFSRTARPTDTWRELAPTSATDLGDSRFFRRYVDIIAIVQSGDGSDSREASSDTEQVHSMRHHNPARWLADDGFGDAAPDDLVQTRMVIGPHHDGVDSMRVGPAPEHLADRAAAALHRFEGRVDSVFPQMIDEIRSGLHHRIGVVVRHRDHPHRCGRLEDRQRVAYRACGTCGMIPGDHDVLESGPEFVDMLLRTEQQRAAGFEEERLDDVLCSAVVRLHGDKAEIAEAPILGQDRCDLVRRHLARSALGANARAGYRIGERVQEMLHVAHLAHGAGLVGSPITGEYHLRPHENILLQRKRGDPRAEIGGDGHAFLDRSKRRPARLADKRQKDILDGHRDSPCQPR